MIMATFKIGQKITFESFGSQGRIQGEIVSVVTDECSDEPTTHYGIRVISQHTYVRMVNQGISEDQARFNASHVIELDEYFLVSPEFGDAEPVVPNGKYKIMLRVGDQDVQVGRGDKEGASPFRFWNRVRLTEPLVVPESARVRRWEYVTDDLADLPPMFKLIEE